MLQAVFEHNGSDIWTETFSPTDAAPPSLLRIAYALAQAHETDLSAITLRFVEEDEPGQRSGLALVTGGRSPA